MEIAEVASFSHGTIINYLDSWRLKISGNFCLQSNIFQTLDALKLIENNFIYNIYIYNARKGKI